MKLFKEYLEEKKVKKGSSDPAQARSLFKQAIARLDDLVALPLNEDNSSFRFESAYECIREAIQSFMAQRDLSLIPMKRLSLMQLRKDY